MARLGHRSVRLGAPHDLLARLGKGELPPLDAALTIAEGWGGREREAWAPVLLAMAKIPTLGSDATTLSVSLDKRWARALVAAAGVPVPPQVVMRSAQEAREAALPAAVSALREAALGGDLEGHRAQLAGREPRRARRRSGPDRSRLRAAGAGRALPRRARVHGHRDRKRSAAGAPGSPARARGRDRNRPARARKAPGAGRAAGATACRARWTPRSSASSARSRCAPSRRSTAATSRARTSGSTATGARSSWRSIRFPPSRRTAPSASSPSSKAGPRTRWSPTCSPAACAGWGSRERAARHPRGAAGATGPGRCRTASARPRSSRATSSPPKTR